MPALSQTGPDLPQVINNYHRARNALTAAEFADPDGPLSFVYEMAHDDLVAEVILRGGAWEVGKLRYTANGRGLEISQISAPPEEMEVIPVTTECHKADEKPVRPNGDQDRRKKSKK